MAESIADLIDLAITNYSADTIYSIGKTLVEGSTSSKDDSKRQKLDEVISKLCSLCNTEETSEIRVSACRMAFVLPSIEDLRAERSHVLPQGCLYRPAESMKSLL
jgi:hypothetical protein